MVMITPTNVVRWRRIFEKITALSALLQEGYCLQDKDSEKVLEMFRYEVAYLRKVKAGFDSLNVMQKIQAIIAEAGLKLETLVKIYSEVMAKSISEEMKKVFKILEVA